MAKGAIRTDEVSLPPNTRDYIFIFMPEDPGIKKYNYSTSLYLSHSVFINI